MDKLPYYDLMTEDMQKVVDDFGSMDDIKEKWLSAYNNYKKADNAYRVKLPLQSVSGEPVCVKAKFLVRSIRDCYYSEMRMLELFLPSDWVNEQLNKLELGK